jgi:biopolymer transport protein ExbD
MNDQVTATPMISQEGTQQNVPSTTTEASSQQQQQQQISVVDDATLQAVLSSMSETEMNAFLEELNKTGKACKKKEIIFNH